MNPDVIGWIASAILLATLVRQIMKSAASDGDDGVSRWLFVGQCLASLGFVFYSVLVENMVFIVTNSAILLTALAGQVLRWRRKRREA